MQEHAPWPVAVWGVGGTLIILLVAVWRIAERTQGLADIDLGVRHWAFASVWLAFMLYTEAWRGFHRQFSPRVVQRAAELPRHPLLMVGAPVVCMGLIHATRRRLFISRGLVVAILILVQIVRRIPTPWRELVDLGVAIGLAAGTVSLAWFGLRAVAGQLPEVDPDYPATAENPPN